MKTIILSLLISSFAQAGFISPFPGSVADLSIPNAHDITSDGTEQLVRGQRPYVDGKKKFTKRDTWSDLSKDSRTWLSELFRGNDPFTDILIFKNGGKEELAGQRQAMEKIEHETGNPIQVTRIHFPWKDISDYQQACEDTVEALQLMKSVVQDSDRKLFFHCTVGEDRTGYLSALWRMLDQGWSRYRAFEEEMCDRGYGRGNPGKPSRVYNEIRQDLTPLYIEMGHLIRQGDLSYRNIDQKVCEHFEGFSHRGYDIRHYKCAKRQP